MSGSDDDTIEITITIPKTLTPRVLQAHREMAEHSRPPETLEGAIRRLVAIGVEEWERHRRED